MATRAEVEGEILTRCGPAMAVVGMDATTQNGSNADLNGPIRMAVRLLGRLVQSDVTVADADLAPVAGTALEKLFDLAERRTLETVLGRYVFVDHAVNDDQVKADQLRQGLRARIEYLTTRLARPYGPGSGGPVSGRIAAGRRRRTDAARGNPWGWPWP